VALIKCSVVRAGARVARRCEARADADIGQLSTGREVARSLVHPTLLINLVQKPFSVAASVDAKACFVKAKT
jgi:hypothetical protein